MRQQTFRKVAVFSLALTSCTAAVYGCDEDRTGSADSFVDSFRAEREAVLEQILVRRALDARAKSVITVHLQSEHVSNRFYAQGLLEAAARIGEVEYALDQVEFAFHRAADEGEAAAWLRMYARCIERSRRPDGGALLLDPRDRGQTILKECLLLSLGLIDLNESSFDEFLNDQRFIRRSLALKYANLFIDDREMLSQMSHGFAAARGAATGHEREYWDLLLQYCRKWGGSRDR